MFKGFRDFILRGNVVELAVAFVIGGAFAALVTSFVDNVLTPLLGFVGVPDFATLTVHAGSAEIRYGAFLNAIIAFVLIAAAIYFFLVVPMQRMRPPVARWNRPSPRCPICTSELSA